VTARVLILGAFGGRIDQQLAGFHVLKSFEHIFHDLILMDDTNLAIMLQANVKHRILINPTLKGRCCIFLSRISDQHSYLQSIGLSLGLLPVFGKVDGITTRGLKWNLGNCSLEFGKLISSSNCLADSEEISVKEVAIDCSSNNTSDVAVVEVETTNDVLWTCELTSP
jgi:thiamine pyrophosphokinase